MEDFPKVQDDFDFNDIRKWKGGSRKSRLVAWFASELAENDVKVLDEGPSTANSCIMQTGKATVCAIIYEYTHKQQHTEHPAFWGVNQKFIKRMQAGKDANWGVILLCGKHAETPLDFGFWIPGENYESVRKYPNRKREVDNIHLRDLEDNPLAKKFPKVQQFLPLSGLNPR